MSFEGVTGARKRKKRVRYGDEDWDTENEPPKAIPKTEKGEIYIKAEAELGNTASLVLGKKPLGPSNATDLAPVLSPSDESRPPIAEAEAKLEEEYCEELLDMPAWERPPGVGMPGQLKNLTLINFMCHEHLYVEFGPHVNFISGQNGSGKSAILQAIQQVLGVKARETGRAATQQAFIKAGCPESRITITLWNEGPEAYLPDIYGKEIIVERRIGKTANYSIKTATGRKVGHRRDELDSILESLQINAANPITVMTQDTTRSFMDGGSGKRDRQKYDIYMEATMLDRIADSNHESAASLRSMNAEVQSEGEKHHALVKEMKALEATVETLKELDECKAEENTLQQALGWSAVAASKEEISRLDNQLSISAPQARVIAEAEKEEAAAQLRQLETNVEEQNQAISTYADDLEEIANDIKDFKKKEAEAVAAVAHEDKKNHRLQIDVEVARKHKEMILSTVRENEEELYANNESANKQFEAKENVILAKREEASAEIARSKTGIMEHSKRTTELYKLRNAAKTKLESSEAYVNSLEKQICKWTKYAKSNISRFGGEKVARIVEVIKSNISRFHKPPVGPVGDLLCLQNQKWAQPVEECLGQAFNNFLVHDSHDYHELKYLCQAEGLKFPPCIIIKLDGERHTVESGLPPSNILTMFHEVDCTERDACPAVMNSLVDQVALESQALAETREMLEEVAAAENVTCVWLPDGSVLRNAKNSSTYYPPSRSCKQPRLGTDSIIILDGLQAKLDLAKAEKEEAKLDYEKEVKALESHRDKRTGKQLALRKAKEMKRELDNELTRLHEDREVPEGDTELGHTLAEALQNLADCEKSMRKSEAELSTLRDTESDAKARVENAAQRLENFQSEHIRMLEEKAGQEEAVQAASAKLEAIEDFSDDLNGRVEKLSAVKQAAERSLEEQVEKANEICDEQAGFDALARCQAELSTKNIPAADLTPDLIPGILAKKLQRLQQKIAKQEASAGGMKIELQAKLRKLERQVNASKRSLDTLTAAYELLNAGLHMRTVQYSLMEKTVEETVNRKFNYYLNKKGHNGSIKVNRSFQEDGDKKIDTSTLEIRVLIDGAKEKGKVKDLKQLSGGERSFTTVAFALALGEYSGSPFRAMDEFDVFMDAINRQTSLESLLTNGLEHKDLQFIFLTPLDISAVEGAKNKIREKGLEISDEFVRIVKLRAARD